MKFKNGSKHVKVLGVKSEMIMGHLVVMGVFESNNVECIITSLADGKHSESSKHYEGNAIDYRTRHIANAAVKTKIITEIKESLTQDFDVVFEDAGTDNEHLHVEFDPVYAG